MDTDKINTRSGFDEVRYSRKIECESSEKNIVKLRYTPCSAREVLPHCRGRPIQIP